MTSQNQLQSIIKEAQEAYQAGRYEDAARLFEMAANQYEESGDSLSAAEMSNNLSVTLLKAGDAPGALAAALGTENVFAQAGQLQKQGIAMGNQAAAYEAMGDLNKALECYQQSADLLKDSGDKEMRSFVLHSLSALQLRMGKQFEAMATMDIALDSKKSLSLKERLLKKLLKVPFRMLGS